VSGLKRFLTRDEAAILEATQPSHITGLTGAAGEYYVAAELSRRGWLATVTIKNSPGTDVLAQRLGTGRVVSIQVKTAGFGNRSSLLLVFHVRRQPRSLARPPSPDRARR
jgi:hypothetical protein